MYKYAIDKENSKKIQGIAVLMMIIHHTFGFPERLLSGISYIGIPVGGGMLETSIASMCKICVSIFAFGTGYGLTHKNVDINYIMRKTRNLLFLYWKVLCLYIFCGLVGGKTYTFISVVKNIFLIKTDIIHSSWYLPFYLLALLTIPIFQKINMQFPKLIVFYGICWFFNYISIDVWGPVSNYFIYMPVVISGMVSAKSKLTVNFINVIDRKGIGGYILSLLLLIVVLCLRVLSGAEWNGFRFIWVYTPIIYMTLEVLVKAFSQIKVFNSAMNFFGKYSTEFWLTNAIYTSDIFWVQWLGYFPKFSILVLVWQIVLLTGVAQVVRFQVSSATKNILKNGIKIAKHKL